MLGFVLRAPRTQGSWEVVPELEQAVIQHDKNSADVARAAAVEIEGSGRCIEIFRVRAVALAIEEFHRNQRIEEVADRAPVQADFGAHLRACKPTIAELGKYFELHRSEENLGRPEGKGSLKDGTGIELRASRMH